MISKMNDSTQKSDEAELKVYAIGADVGGTRLKAAIVDNEGKTYFLEDIPTIDRSTEKNQVVPQVLKVCRSLLKRAEQDPRMRGKILGIGIGVTGQVDFSEGRIIGGISDKLPGWIGTPLKALVEKEFNIPTIVDNDGKVAALAEYLFGNHRDFKDLVCITVGTGVGSGLIIDGKLHRPSRWAAGEIGHTTINFEGPLCGCGHRGCIEAYVSSSALINYARNQLSKERKGRLYDLCGGRLDNLTPELIGKAAREGDPIAKNAIKIMANYLGIGLANITNILGPDIIVIGGGLSRLGGLLLKSVQEAVMKYSFFVCAKNTRVVLSSLGPYAGVIGAGALIFQEFLKRAGKSE